MNTKIDKEKDVEPFGEEWREYMLRLPKKEIIYLFRLLAIEKKEEIERAFRILDLYGVPRERAVTISNGIDILVTRYKKALNGSNEGFKGVKS